MLYHSILVLASATIGALARPTQDILSLSKPRPLVIWHGLGESLLQSNGKASDQVGLKATPTPPLAWCNFSLSSPRCTPEYSYTRYISIQMRRKTNELHLCVPCTLTPPPAFSFTQLTLNLSNQYGNVDDQVEQVAEQLKVVPELSGGFDAIGFSQGS
jgi:hypothetical protein